MIELLLQAAFQGRVDWPVAALDGGNVLRVDGVFYLIGLAVLVVVTEEVIEFLEKSDSLVPIVRVFEVRGLVEAELLDIPFSAAGGLGVGAILVGRGKLGLPVAPVAQAGGDSDVLVGGVHDGRPSVSVFPDRTEGAEDRVYVGPGVFEAHHHFVARTNVHPSSDKRGDFGTKESEKVGSGLCISIVRTKYAKMPIQTKQRGGKNVRTVRMQSVHSLNKITCSVLSHVMIH